MSVVQKPVTFNKSKVKSFWSIVFHGFHAFATKCDMLFIIPR